MNNHDNTKKNQLIKEVGFEKYFQAQTWEEYNKKFFDGLAEKYDATNILHSFGTKKVIDRKAIEKLSIPKNAKILDVCAGSGDISIRIATDYPDAQITAVDASEKMLEIAKRKAVGLTNIDYKVGDALQLPYPDNSFDLAIISFGLRNLTRLEDGLREMKRVVKEGGWVCNIDQGKPTNPFFKPIYHFHFYYIAPLLGKLIFHRGEFNSFRYLPESNKYFPSQENLVNIFKEIGFKNVQNFDYWCGAVAQQIGQV